MQIIAYARSILRPVRFVIVAFTCALVLFFNAFPATAIDSYKSDPTEATDQLVKIQKETDKLATEAPPGLEEVQERASKGPNEIQGGADLQKQNTPENSQSANSVEDEIKGFLDRATGSK